MGGLLRVSGLRRPEATGTQGFLKQQFNHLSKASPFGCCECVQHRPQRLISATGQKPLFVAVILPALNSRSLGSRFR